jgi:hypothetical protein
VSRYAVLILPSANRVYADSSVSLVQSEIAVFNDAVLDGRIRDIGTAPIGGVPYVVFDCDDLTERDVALLANLSSLYALFRIEGDLLRPVAARGLDRFDDDLVTILKYPGKTNEQFTKLLLNVTLLSSGFATEMLQRRFTLMDPMCGRGTTLNQALMYGFDANGMDIDERDVEAYATFLPRWLKDKRLKHQCDYAPVRRDRRVVARRLTASFAATKEAYKSGDVQHLDVVNADAVTMLDFFRPASMDLVVTDAPYGVLHGSRTNSKRLARSPLDLLAECAPVWARCLTAGGALGIAWNTHVAHRADAAAALTAAGLSVVEFDSSVDFRHRVDQSIQRDILIARKP